MMEQVDLQQAHDELMHALFGTDKALYPEWAIHRSVYTKAMKKIQDKYGLKQGHPQFLEWVFTCVGRSPIIIEDEDEGAGENGKDGKTKD